MSRVVYVRSSQDLGELIAEARRRAGKTQRQLAEELGVTQAWISRVERGQQKAWIGKVLRLASYLGILQTRLRDRAVNIQQEFENFRPESRE